MPIDNNVTLDHNSKEMQELAEQLFKIHPEFNRLFINAFGHRKSTILNLISMEKSTLISRVQSRIAKDLVNKIDDFLLLELVEKKLKTLLVIEAGKDETLHVNNLTILRNIKSLLSNDYIHNRVLADDEVIGNTFLEFVMEYFEMDDAFLFLDIFYYKR